MSDNQDDRPEDISASHAPEASPEQQDQPNAVPSGDEQTAHVVPTAAVPAGETQPTMPIPPAAPSATQPTTPARNVTVGTPSAG
ncbi:MAG: hypothetical protein J0J11_03435, partial [Microbacterium sp.]|nr:hypothetical protein [Microbacterium sp.]